MLESRLWQYLAFEYMLPRVSGGQGSHGGGGCPPPHADCHRVRPRHVWLLLWCLWQCVVALYDG